MGIAALNSEGVARAVQSLRPRAAASREVEGAVAAILASVSQGGDEALLEATRRLDWPEATLAGLRVLPGQLESALAGLDEELREAFEVARANLSWFHMHERPSDWDEEGRYGQRLGIRHLPVRRAGLYVPGGLAAYSSTVIMNAVPAQVAGVSELFIVTPPDRQGGVNPSVLAAASFMGIEEVYRVGGAQAVAAMAYGTALIPPADVVCGPGNAYVMEAKRQVYGQVGIDGLAGPSEVIVVAGDRARPEWVAADLLAQEEHGSGASAILLAESEGFCGQVAAAEKQLRGPSGGASFEQDLGLRAFFPGSGEDFVELALSFVNAYGPEHLELRLEEARSFASRVTSAGAVFIGSQTPTAYGDYVAGSNHVLPTGGAARFSSPLSVDTFLRKTSMIELNGAAVRLLTPHLARLADSEGFGFHRLSAELRAGEVGEAEVLAQFSP
jgi:histidinol dehydrogenase